MGLLWNTYLALFFPNLNKCGLKALFLLSFSLHVSSCPHLQEGHGTGPTRGVKFATGANRPGPVLLIVCEWSEWRDIRHPLLGLDPVQNTFLPGCRVSAGAEG